MWFQLCFSIVLLQVLNVNLTKQRKTIKATNEDAEAIFADVIKNISRVNSVLQDLINNYEHLQKIYQSQENLESQTSDGEVDEVFKTKREKERKNGQERSKSELPTSTTYDGNPATQIIWSADEGRSDNSEVISSEGNNSDIAGTDDKKDTEKPNVEPAYSHNNSSSSNEEKNVDPENIKKNSNRSKNSNVIFIGTHISAIKNKHIKPSLEPLDKIMLHDATTTKLTGSKKHETRYSKVSQSRVGPRINEKHKSAITLPDEYFRITDGTQEEQSQELHRTKATTTSKSKKEATKVVQKKLHSETFSNENFWDGIINNKPIQLETYSDVAFENMRKDGDDLKSLIRDVNLKQRIERGTKTAPVVVARQNQISNNEINITENSATEDAGSEELQANVLRKAYGDACLKVVMKKCYKACRSAGKDVCSKFKCKEEYKQMFDKNVRTGCIMEFDVNTGDKGKNIRDWEDVFYRSRYDKTEFGIQNRTDDSEHDERFKNSTKSWYMQSCLPLIETGSRRPSDASVIISKKSPKLGQQSTDLNILRDRFEKACQKASNDKCNKACTFASDKVCESYTCKRDRRSSYKKSCRRKCKITYGSTYSSDSSISTSMSGSSDSSYSSDTS